MSSASSKIRTFRLKTRNSLTPPLRRRPSPSRGRGEDTLPSPAAGRGAGGEGSLALNREKYAMMLHTATGSLTPTPPFDFDKSLDFLGFFAPMEGEQTLAARALAKAVLIHGQIVVFEIAMSGSIEQPQLDYTLHSDRPISDTTRSRRGSDRFLSEPARRPTAILCDRPR
jgi:hypothetical protein